MLMDFRSSEVFAKRASESMSGGDGEEVQLQALDRKVAWHFVVKDQRITSKSGVYAEPAFAIIFKDAAYGFATMPAKNKQLAFTTGIQDKSIQIKGNPALVIWFQGLTKWRQHFFLLQA